MLSWSKSGIVEARYPNAIEDTIPAVFYRQADADRAIEMAGRVLDTIGTYLDIPHDQES